MYFRCLVAFIVFGDDDDDDFAVAAVVILVVVCMFSVSAFLKETFSFFLLPGSTHPSLFRVLDFRLSAG